MRTRKGRRIARPLYIGTRMNPRRTRPWEVQPWIFHHFALVRMAPCVFWIVMNLFCRLHFQSSCVSAFIILRERIGVFSCRLHCVFCRCVCVCPCDMVCSRLKLKPDAFVDMGLRLGSTKHVLVSVVVQMTDNLVISLACCPEFTVITWFRPFNGELACCDIPGVVIRSILRGSLH